MSEQPLKKICVLGATGSIGINTLDVVRQHPEKFKVVSLSANNNIALLHKQCVEFKPSTVVIVDEQAANSFKKLWEDSDIFPLNILSGSSALCELASATEVDLVMAAIVGAAGLPSSLAAAKAGKRVLLANKESIVMSGALFMNVVHENNAELLPIDSEHNAVFQCMDGAHANPARINRKAIKRVILTASGGPFLHHELDQLKHVTPDEACAHPKWQMGRKISVDSATLMNKGLEVIEACLLFGLRPDQVEVVIHPQSIVHSMVEYLDGSVIAQMANPDMKIPIAYGMSWPERIETGVDVLDLVKCGELNFFKPDLNRFPCLALAYGALQSSSSAIVALNASNEIAVQAFLESRIPFLAISAVIEKTMSKITEQELNSLDEILALDCDIRNLTHEVIKQFELEPR